MNALCKMKEHKGARGSDRVTVPGSNSRFRNSFVNVSQILHIRPTVIKKIDP